MGKRLAATPALAPSDDVSWAPDGKTLATGHQDGTVRFWRTEDLEP
jgi:WD40 repeat protein